MLQPEGVGETLAVAIANKKDGEEEEVVWILDDSYNNKDAWTPAAVEVRAREPAQDFEYRVIKTSFKTEVYDWFIFMSDRLLV